MAICIVCGVYFKPCIANAYDTKTCPDCIGVLDYNEDPELEVEKQILTNPSGKVQPKIEDDDTNYFEAKDD